MKTSRPRIYLDLDRTLFQTKQLDGIWRIIEELHPSVTASIQPTTMQQYYVANQLAPELSYFDMTSYLSSIGLNADEIYQELSDSPASDGRLEFDGVSDLIAYLSPRADVAILTYGDDRFQRWKASLCPSLRGLNVYTTLMPKEQWLEDKGACWLVDDKPVGFVLPDAVRFVQVYCEKPMPAQPIGAWPHCQSVREVRSLFTGLLG